MNSTFTAIKQYLDAHHVQLVAVSKTRPVEALMALYDKGQRHFGENRVQEMRDKYEVMPKDIHWHLIGHLQRNKVKYVAPWVHMIHSVDSLELLTEIDRQAEKADRVIPCLLQMYIADEKTKFGLNEAELQALLSSEAFRNLHHVEICGLMGMATNTNNTDQIRAEFARLNNIFIHTQKTYFPNTPAFREISMGMSSDYTIAIEQGSTMVRVGSLLFS